MAISRDVVIKPLVPELHDDLLHFFDVIAFADNPHWAKCFCMFFMRSSSEEHDSKSREQNRTDRSGIVRSGKGNGLLAYRLGRVVGWCHAAPKPQLPLLASWDGTMIEPRVGAVVCFMVAPDARRQGVATALLDAACEYLRGRGMTAVEAYPPPSGSDDPALWPRRNYHGPLSMFQHAGFKETSRNEWAITVRREL
jgi:GNAT superfamily N-acetyltransferase